MASEISIFNHSRYHGYHLFCYHRDLFALSDLLCHFLRNLSRYGVVALNLGEIVVGDNVVEMHPSQKGEGFCGRE